MVRRFGLPMFVVAAAMLGLMAALAVLQYRWLGQISTAERERMSAMLSSRAAAFTQEVDRELSRAYLVFQMDARPDGNVAARLATRYDHWQATARYPRMVAGIYVVDTTHGSAAIERYNHATRFVEPADWPAALAPLKALLTAAPEVQADGAVLIRPVQQPLLETVPAIVVATPVIFFSHVSQRADAAERPLRLPARMSYTVLMLDRDYIVDEMLPAVAQQHFRGTGDGVDYQLAVVRTAARDVLYHSAADFKPAPEATADAVVDFFQVRPQDFGALAAEVRRFSAFVTERSVAQPAGRPQRTQRTSTVVREAAMMPPGGAGGHVAGGPLSIILQPPGALPPARTDALASAVPSGTRSTPAPKWKLLVKHPSGSLEAAVQAARRKNVLVSSGILAILGVSMGLLVLSTRRAQRLATQQMEFVAAVSHELRTPLAVIRSAGENLADGVVRSDEQIRKYGDLVKNEGRRLTEMVEQILEFSGIQSGQRGIALRPVPMQALLEDVVDSSRTLMDEAAMDVEMEVPESLPPALGDEAALRRVFQNLVGNAIKYGARGGWLGIRGRAAARDVEITVSDRGIGIAPAEQTRIFEPFYRTPDVITAQIQGAGLGLSLVKRIVEGHGGRITVRSAPGEGSAFTVHLPIATQEPIAAAGTADSHQPVHPATLRS